MSWTPYAGDPYAQAGEMTPSQIGTPEGKGQGSPRTPHPFTSRMANMNSGQRLQVSMAGAQGVDRFTPDQLFFRDSLGTGRWGGRIPLEPGEIAKTSMNMIRRHPDGTCDLIGLEVDGKFYLDLGGHGGRDVGVGKP